MKKFAFALLFLLPFITALFAQSQVSITVVNNTGYEVYYVYISPSASSYWGEDRLPWNQTLRNNQSVSLQLPDPRQNRYNIRLIDLDGDSYTKMNVPVSANARIVFTFDDFDSGTAQQQQPRQQTSPAPVPGGPAVFDFDQAYNHFLNQLQGQQAQQQQQPQSQQPTQQVNPGGTSNGAIALQSGDYRSATYSAFLYRIDASTRTMTNIDSMLGTSVLFGNYEINGSSFKWMLTTGHIWEGYQILSSDSFRDSLGNIWQRTTSSNGGSSGGSVGSSNGGIPTDHLGRLQCQSCHGSGRCSSCAGRGYTRPIGSRSDIDCTFCSGSGQCRACFGRGYR